MHYLRYLDRLNLTKGGTKFPLSTGIGAPDTREFTSFGTGYLFLIEGTTAAQAFGGSRVSQNLLSITVTQSASFLNTGGLGATILGDQMDISMSAIIGSGREAITITGPGLRIRPSTTFGATATDRVNNWLGAYSPGSYFKVYFKTPSDQDNQYREFFVENADQQAAGFVKYVSDTPWDPLDYFDEDNSALGLEAGQPMRFEFYPTGDPN